MESLSDTLWDLVICGTGLQQSLLALSLSRSGKKILHIDPKEYYGGPDAAFGLQEAESWQAEQAASPSQTSSSIFSSATITRPAGSAGLGSARAYSLALSPQIIHARSALLSQLVSSRAYRQIEFLAVGSFFILKPSSPSSDSSSQTPTLSRIPSTREDVFSTTAIPARAKRSLMKFLKFVLDHDNPSNTGIWQPHADEPLAGFLGSQFNLDAELQAYILTLTLSLDGNVTTRDGLSVLHRHLTSMGVFGSGFAAVYPKWGGTSEIAQVACRACAVGGGIYILGNGIESVAEQTADEPVEVRLNGGISVKTKLLVRGGEERAVDDGEEISRLVAVIGSPLRPLFETVVEGAPTPTVAVIALPPGSVTAEDGTVSEYPVYVFAHSSDTGECPTGQSVMYFTTLATAKSKLLLEAALSSLLAALTSGDQTPSPLYQLYYQQVRGSKEIQTDGKIVQLPAPSLSLAFDDSTLESVRQVWKTAMESASEELEAEYMVFPDREGADAYDDDDYE